MKTLTEIVKETWEEKRKYFENIDFYAKKIKKLATEVLGNNIKVVLFGSIVKGDWGPNSDIDVLIISKNLPLEQEKRGEIRTKIKKKIGSFSPFQFHLVTLEEFKNWYKNFIKKDYIEIKK